MEHEISETKKILFDIWKRSFLTNNHFDNNLYEEFLYNCHWHPAMGLHLDFALTKEILAIKNCENDFDKAIPKVDEKIFRYYSDELVEKLLAGWSQYITDHRYKILSEAIAAYFRQEYALALCTFCCLWSNIINQIVTSNENKIEDARRNYKQISEESSWYYKFFDNQIYYDCRSYDSIKDDVPGRNALAHGYFKSYPSKKAALNAIIFTDYLMRLRTKQ